jgi:hypothetical protein
VCVCVCVWGGGEVESRMTQHGESENFITLFLPKVDIELLSTGANISSLGSVSKRA